MKERQRHRLNRTVYALTGDKLICRVDDRLTKKTYTFSEDIGRTLEIDTVVTFDIDEPVLGLVDGIGAIFGKAK